MSSNETFTEFDMLQFISRSCTDNCKDSYLASCVRETLRLFNQEEQYEEKSFNISYLTDVLKNFQKQKDLKSLKLYT